MSKLILPPNIRSVKPTAYVCTLCKTEFSETERLRFEQHCVKCAKRHEPEINAMSPRTKAPGLYGDDAGDIEYAAWARKHGRV